MTDMCEGFSANAWKPDLCINCQKHESEHKSQIKTKDQVACSSDQQIKKGLPDSSHRGSQRQQQIFRPSEPPPKPVTDKATSQPWQQSQQLQKPSTPKSKLPTRTSPCVRPVEHNPPVVTIPQDKGQGNSSVAKALTLKSPPPKPQRVVNRSESERVRVRPQPPTKPAKPSRTTESIVSSRIGFYRQNPLSPSRKSEKLIVENPKMETEGVLTPTSKGRESIDTASALRNIKPQLSRDDSRAEIEHETFQNTLQNLNLDPENLHTDDYDALHHIFLNYQNYHEHLHESPFHKLAVKIKHHHNKHINGTFHRHRNSKLRHHSSYVSTEGFYGSADVTNLANHQADKPADVAQSDEPANVTKLASQNANNPSITTLTNQKTDRPISEYDNANLTSSPSKVDTVSDNFTSAVDTSGYDNALTSSQRVMASPKYDPVAREMTVSHDSNASERIYAEVTEEIVCTAITG